MSFPGPPECSRLVLWLRAVWGAGVDLVFPRLCCVCRAPVEEGWFCEGCVEGLPWVEEPYCGVCGEVYEGAMAQGFRCMNCGGRRLEFEFAVAACRAEGVAREMVHRFKYERRLHLRGALAGLLAADAGAAAAGGGEPGGVAAGAGAAAFQPGGGPGV